jgi:hypothetical protein
MNDLDMIRALLDEAPPSADVIAEGRRRIAVGATRPRRLRARPVLPGAGLAAAALVAAGAIALAATAGMPGSLGRSDAHGVPAPPASSTLTVTELAYRAAAAAARQPDVRPGQWVYRKYLTKYLTKDFRSGTTEFWTTANSLKAAWVSAQGKVHFFSGLASLGMTAVPLKLHGRWEFFGFQFVPVKYQHLSSLPRSPKALDRYLGHLLPRRYGPKAFREFLIIGGMLTAYVMPPDLTAELYRALGDIPGVTVDNHVVDVAGRHGVAFKLRMPAVGSGVAPEIIINPRTYHLMADELVIPRTPGSRGRAVSAEGTAILQEALVSGPGIRP